MKVASPEIEDLEMSSITRCCYFHLCGSRFSASISVINFHNLKKQAKKAKKGITESTGKAVQSSFF